MSVTSLDNEFTFINNQKPPSPGLSFFVGLPDHQKEMLKITEDGFYVRGQKIPVDEKEGIAVFNALKRFLIETELRKPYDF